MDYQGGRDREAKVTSLFQPDTLISDQYLSGYKSKQLDPGKRLMLAVLQDAICCFQEYLISQDLRKKALFLEAELWIMEEGKDWIFSFDNVCEALEVDPRYLRSGLLRWKRNRVANDPKRPIGKKRKWG